MSVVELYGKCKELGHCDCGGFFGCGDPGKFAANEPLVAMVECTVCDRSHAPSHPHIANIDGDDPVDTEPAPAPAKLLTGRPVGRAALPEWLKDKPGAHVIQPATSSNTAEDKELCQVCGNPWAPKHACKGAEPSGTEFNRPKGATPYHMRHYAKCDVCGKKQQSNHKCQGQPKTGAINAARECEYCKAAGQLCVRHGGRWSGYDTARGETDERAAKTLPAPISVTQPVTTDTCRNGHLKTPENGYIRSDGRRECKQCKKEYKNTARPAPPAEADRELAAIGTILAALDGLSPDEVQRAFAYVADRKGINKEQAK